MTLLAGTVILVLQSAHVIYIGVDSKVIAVSTTVANAAVQPKVHVLNGVLFAHAGIFRDHLGKLDVIASANAAIAADGDLEQIIQRFIPGVEGQLRAVLPDIKAENPTYFEMKMKQPLAMLFATARDGAPRFVAITFDIAQASTDVSHRTVRCPGDCDPKARMNAISLGEHEASDRFLDSYPKGELTRDPVTALKRAVAVQAQATPEMVSLPARIFSVSSSGVHEVR